MCVCVRPMSVCVMVNHDVSGFKVSGNLGWQNLNLKTERAQHDKKNDSYYLLFQETKLLCRITHTLPHTHTDTHTQPRLSASLLN